MITAQRWPSTARFALVAALSVALTGCVTINVGPATEPPESPSTTAPAFDDTAALGLLGGAIGGLFGYVENHDAENCNYLALLASQADDSTPDPSYQGTYEQIATNLETISLLCSLDLNDRDAITLAKLTRRDCVEILNARRFLGQTIWGGAEPVDGAGI